MRYALDYLYTGSIQHGGIYQYVAQVYPYKMKKLRTLLAIIVVSVLVSLVYFYFESAAHHAINLIWNDWLNTGANRLLVIPVCLVLSLVFFGLQHHFDPKSEQQESHGLGSAPKPTFSNFAKVLGIGFFSLIAGASLGPEAILVPASLLVGAIAGSRWFKNDVQIINMLSMVGFIALFAAFFDSFIAGILGLVLVAKEVKVKLSPALIAIASAASLITVYTLGVLGSDAYVSTPKHVWAFSLESLLAVLGLGAAGYGATYMLSNTHSAFKKLHDKVVKNAWWQRAVIAASGLSLLYLLGGPLIQFTGNESIVPMVKQSAELGSSGLLALFLMKILAISWSKALGYRGGLIFPCVFAASTLVMIAHVWAPGLSFIVGLVAVLVGMFAADRKAKILL